MYSLDYAEIQLANCAKTTNKWIVRRLNGIVGVYWRNIISEVGNLRANFLANFLPGWSITVGVGLNSYSNNIVHKSLGIYSRVAMKYKNSLSSFTIIIDRENSNSLYQGVRANVLCVVFGFIEVVLVDKRVVATYWPDVLKSNNKTNLHWEKWIVLKQLHSLQFISILSCTMLRVITWLDNLLLITYLNTWAMNYEPREITVVDNLLRNDKFHYILGALNILGNEFQHILRALKPPGLPEGIESANQPAIVKGCGEMFPLLKNSRKGFNFFFHKC
uniref:ADP/ATP translocase n=1 Tax=Nicotiana sylvestris TaxID=4096 RepID=A0A1U7XYZ8_NICSY|nr:PREDICTED: uncharacterized protein LOC104241626 [Nicotiana sylvestris]